MTGIQLTAVILVGLTVMIVVFLGSIMVSNRKNAERKAQGRDPLQD